GPPLAAGQRVDPQGRAVPDEPDRRDVRAARPEARQPAGPLHAQEGVPLLLAHRDHPTAPLLSHANSVPGGTDTMIVNSFRCYLPQTVHDHESTRGARRVGGCARLMER